MKIKIIIPVYNDWKSVFKLLENINSEISSIDAEFSIIIINDGSTDITPKININFDHIKYLKILNLKKNMSHQRSIAIGLKYIYEKENFDFAIPMDGDGEDRPEEIKEFYEKIKNNSKYAIVGERVKRSEGVIFKLGYEIHKLLTLSFTGNNIKFGNFTCLPRSIVAKLLNEKATWNSYSGSLTKTTKKRINISSIRGKRYFDLSKMSYLNLIKHSISIIGVFKFGVILRSLLFSLIYLFLVYPKITIITIIPIVFIIALIISVLVISKRENISEFDNALSNINNIEEIK